MFYLFQQKPHVATSEAVNGLFYVPHNQHLMAGSQGIENEGFQVVPLKVGGVLKLVNQDVAKEAPEFFKNKRRIVFPHNLPDECVVVGDEHDVLLVTVCFEVAVEGFQQAKGIDIAKECFGRAVVAFILFYMVQNLYRYGK